MSRRLVLNSAANFTARVASAALSVVSVPLYLRLLGRDAFGLMAFVVATQSLLSLLDLGLAATANREVAREQDSTRRADLVRTLEVIYWGMSLVVLAAMMAGAAVATNFWLNLGSQFSPAEAWTALALAGLGIAVRWPVALYSGVLQGLELQFHASLVLVAGAVVRVIGGIAIVLWVTPSVIAVFTWYVFSALFEVGLARYLVIKTLGTGHLIKGRFKAEIVSRVWKVAAGFSLVGALGTVGANLDKLLLSKHLAIADLGLYSSIAMLASTLTIAGNAVSMAAFPRLARAFGEVNEVQLLRAEFSDALALILWAGIPVLCVLVFARVPVIELWTGSNQGNIQATAVLLILSMATLINAFANPFYTAVMASGRTGILLVTNAVIVLVLIPLLWILLPKYGLLAAAGGFLLNNLSQMACVMIRFATSWPSRKWWWNRLCTIAAVGGTFLLVFVFVRVAGPKVQLISAVAACVTALGVSALWVPGLRGLFVRKASL